MSDDFAANPSTTGVIQPGQSVNGTVETGFDQDWFRIELGAGILYEFALTPSAGSVLDPLLRLFDSGGNLLASNDDVATGNVSSYLSGTLSVAGTYFLSAGGYDVSTGGYTLSVQGSGGSSSDDFPESAPGALAAGSAINGIIETGGDTDRFLINLVAGQQYRFTLDPDGTSGLRDPVLRLLDDNGNLLVINDDTNGSLSSAITVTATRTGVYQLVAAGYGDLTGGYVLRATGAATTGGDDVPAGTAATLTPGTPSNGAIEVSGDTDRFTVSLTAGTTYVIDVEGSGSNAIADTVLQLLDGGGRLLAENDDANGTLYSRIIYTPTTTGNHTLVVSGYGSATGSYKLSASNAGSAADDHGNTAGTATALTAGNNASGQIERSGDLDVFAINLVAGQRYQFNLDPTASGGLSDPVLALADPSQQIVASNDDAGSGTLASRIDFVATQSGTHYLLAGGYGAATGAYTLSTTGARQQDDFGNDATTQGRIAAGQTVNGTLEQGGDQDWFAVDLVAGTRYQFRADSAAGGLPDPLLTLLDSSGQVLAQDNNSGGGLNALIDGTPSVSGRYFLAVTGTTASMTGAYSLSAAGSTGGGGGASDDFAGSTATAGRLSAGSSISGVIEQAGDEDWFAIRLTQGQQYTFNLDPGSGTALRDPTLSLYDDNGQLLTSNDDANGLASELTVTATRTGTYFLGAAGYGSETGNYVLTASGAVTTAPSDDFSADTATTGRLTVGGSTSGRIETATDVDFLAIDLTAGQTYAFSVTPRGGSSSPLADPRMAIFDAAGRQLAFNDDASASTQSAGLDFTASTSGRFFVGVAGPGNTTGDYSVSAQSRSAGAPASSFNIEIVYTGDPQFQSFFDAAAARWSQVIVGDLPDFAGVDDLRISASVTSIDGPGRILAQAGPTAIRPNNGLPYQGQMQFDSADIGDLVSKGTFGDVVLHEMGHVLGFLSFYFEQYGLVNPNNSFQYTGTNALTQYRNLSDPNATFVPIEQLGGPGTAGSHWDETLFRSELMTGFAENQPPMPISVLTVGLLQDLGYQVNYGAADPYQV